LSSLISALPTDDVSNDDIKSLILQLLLDTADDDSTKHYANRSRVKLEAIKLLLDVNRSDDVGDYEKELLDILAKKGEEG